MRSQLRAQLQELSDALDSVADLTLAESVHQLLRGNTVRAGATLDAIARGDTPPPELEVVQTPRTGTGVTHRLLAVASAIDPAGWTKTAREQAEPRLNAWAGAIFGNPSRVRARAKFASGTAIPVPVEFGLDALGIAPLDLLALPESNSIIGELADRLARAAAGVRPAGVPAGTAITLIEERDPSWTPDVLSVSEFLELVWKVSRVVAGARAMTPQDLTAPGSSPGSIDTQDLQTRADNAETLLRDTYAALLGTSSSLDAQLLAAANFGIPDAFPSQDQTQWSAQASAAASAVKVRMTALDTLAAGFVRTAGSDDARRVHDAARLNAIFGDNFLVLPALDSTYTAGWTQLWGSSAALQGGDPLAASTWFQRMARIRPGVSRLDVALLYAESLAGTTLSHFNVAQLPATNGDRWLALAHTGAKPSGRLSLVAFAPQSIASGAAVAGLIIDEWVEVLPDAQQITGISLHHDDPTARAPQALLLAVCPDDFPEWTLESLEGTVLEALDLAKLRAVDPDALNGLGHYLPALYFAYNTGGPQVDTVSTDFNLARASVAHEDWLMASVTIWNRLEPRCRTQDLSSGLAAPIYDPLWLLARQWQVGEFAGRDAGSPLTVQVQWSTAPFDRFQSGAAPVTPYDGTQPLETIVEWEAVRPPKGAVDLRQSAEAGLQFLRLLDAANLSRLRPAYVGQYPLAAPPNTDADTQRMASVFAGRTVDGIQLRADLVQAAGKLPATSSAQRCPQCGGPSYRKVLDGVVRHLVQRAHGCQFLVACSHGV